MDRRGVLRLIGGLTAAGFSGAAAACATPGTGQGPGSAAPTRTTLSFGLIAPTVGPYAAVGAGITDGFKLYLGLNQNLLGLHNVDLKVADEGATVADATKAMKSLLDAGVMAVAGVASPAALAALAPQAVSAKVPLVSAYAAPANISGTDFVWRASSLLGEAGQAAAVFAATEGNRAFVLSDGSADAAAEVSGFTAGYSARGGVIAGTSTGSDGLSSRLSGANAANADVIFAAHSGDSALALLDAYRSSGMTIKVVGPSSLTESIDLTKLSPLPRRVYTTGFYAPNLANDQNHRFAATYEDNYGAPPTSVVAAAYDAAMVLDRAVQLVNGNPDGSKINDAMKALGRINSPRGNWAFNANHCPEQTWYLRQLGVDGQVPSNLLDSNLVVLP